jgi:uncharacterized membrane-anchored protein
MTLPPDHAQRIALNDEVHARPTTPMSAPLRLSYLALVSDGPPREAGWNAVRDLMLRYGAPPPAPGANHHRADLGPFRLRWESHAEFNRFTILAPGGTTEPFRHPALGAVPADWVAALPGRIMVASHCALLREGEIGLDQQDIARLFAGNPLVGSAVAGGGATAFTDFRIHGDGFSRILVLDRSMNAPQAGRTLQRLLEIDTYRMLALLALGVARDLAPFLRARELELARITNALVAAREADEPGLLERLTRMEAEIESREAENLYRFSASRAYYELVRQRTVELRETRIEGLPTFQEFTERRLAPAMDFCRSTSDRQESLAERVARATQLLSTRVDVSREQQSQALLESMNRRAQLQLRLQSTVEGLSVAAVTYYVVALVGHLASGLEAGGVRLNPEIAAAASVPVVAAIVAYGLHKTRKMVHHE